MIRIRPAELADAPTLTELYQANRRFLAPWEPVRDESFYTEPGQRERLAQAVRERTAGTGLRCVIELDGGLVGMISLSEVVRGVAQTAHLGYWVVEAANGRGVATEAVRLMLDLAFGTLDLHRLEAGTMPHNLGSQRVLERNGFTRIGLAPAYLLIAGEWQDHILFQRLADTATHQPR